ncbi:MAG: hypothetical protein ASARMPREDX12_004067 [Alectoria sarmentosa]|nr:MAG: hypothetical protein ASARMPREDX12_004067 [Alectoria sarmentosa]
MADSSSKGKGKETQRIYYWNTPENESPAGWTSGSTAEATAGSTDNDTTPRPEKPEQEERSRQCIVVAFHEPQTPTGSSKYVVVRRCKAEANFPGMEGASMMQLHHKQKGTSPNIFYPVTGEGDKITVTFFRNVSSNENAKWGIRWGERRPGA